MQNSEDLTKPIAKTELLCIIKQKATGKTPVPDGIATEFYRKCWHIIGDAFTQVLNEIHEKGIIPDEIKSGIITLVHTKNKKEDLKLQTNFTTKHRLENIHQNFSKSS